MIYQYIKANPKVAEYLGIATQRLQFPDGNYLLWKFDLMPLGGNNDATIRLVGGVGMNSSQCRDEQRGITVTALPEAEDERFRMSAANTEEKTAADGQANAPEETAGEDEPGNGDTANGGETEGGNENVSEEEDGHE